MAKFKVGDKVEDMNGEIWKVVKLHPDLRQIDVDPVSLRSDRWVWADEQKFSLANSLVSTNAVVANALAARTACNRYTSWPYRGTFRVGQEVVMNPDAARGMGYSGPKQSRVEWVSKDGKTATAFGGLEITGDEACPRNEMEIADQGELKMKGYIKNALAAKGAVAKNTKADQADDIRAYLNEAEKNLMDAERRFGGFFYSIDDNPELEKKNKKLEADAKALLESVRKLKGDVSRAAKMADAVYAFANRYF